MTPVLFSSSSGWSFLALSTTWLHRCSPAVLQPQCCPVQPKSGHWRRSWPPPDVWQHAKLWARWWHSDASRRESPGLCTGPFPGRTVLMRWVYCNINDLNAFPPPPHFFFFLSPNCFFLIVHRFSPLVRQWKMVELPWVNLEGNISGREFRCPIKFAVWRTFVLFPRLISFVI